ncbi:glycosyltransferase family 2 protein [Pseudooceanicola sp. HF7]|uniref:glycosyltransferase family 2 protein n=1 Tax=Pseudooceanicola sp. HF7 TaxID=2721560 RepID=UPI001430456E|nr:glycosyltransferase family 2 protein [Pseudooceanicola sp. HF7]NIZ09223.1 glycosyltransferase family 2 protein [Pseudooceanicola sp. HF7]
MSLRWGIVATMKAPAQAVLDFAAWHLELGAHRLYLHLDDPADPVAPTLKAHPRIRAIRCTDGYWQRQGQHPKRHQVRQSANATRIYHAAAGKVDWLTHIDVDEFLMPATSVHASLSALPASCQSARIRPMEALAPDGPAPDDASSLVRFKRFSPDPDLRRAQTSRIYPQFGDWLNGGMLSHVAGKLFVRPGLPGGVLKIHNLFTDMGQNPGIRDLADMALAHFHAADWDSWSAHFAYRLEKGSYRETLKPAAPGQETLHELLARIHGAEGQDGLRRFYDAVCRDTPELRARLAAEDLLSEAQMDFPALRRRHFRQAAHP